MDVFRCLRLFTPPLALLFTIGCTSVSGSALPLPASNLHPYLTVTPAVSPSATAVVTDIPVPTPTPSTYTVTAGDNLSSIAERFGISLADLLAANPGVVPEALSLGQTLKIPASSPGANSSSASTPAPAEIGPVQCYPAGTGLYCLAPLRNPFTEALENLKLQITLLDANGQSLASREAFLPLNILPPESALPAYAYFPAQAAPADGAHPIAQLVASIRLRSDDARYLPAAVRNVLTSVGWNGRSAQVQGQIFLPAESKPASTIWLAAVAYGTDHQVVGFRRWEWQGTLQPGTLQLFDFSVYSFGPMIERVDIIVEARP